MDIPGTGIHIPLWLVYAATFIGLVANAYITSRNSTKTKQLGVTVNDQFSQVATMVTQFQTSSQALMQMVLDAKDADFKELQSKYKTLEKDLEGYKVLTEGQASDLVKQSSKILSLENLLGDVRRDTTEKIKVLSSQLSESKAQLSDKDVELAKRAQEILALTEKLKKMEALEHDVIQLQADVVELRAKLKTVAEERDRFMMDMKKLEADLDATKQELDAANQRAERLEQENKTLRAELATEKKRGTGRLVAQAGGDVIATPTVATVAAVIPESKTDKLDTQTFTVTTPPTPAELPKMDGGNA